jgi:hypothetical protein
MIIAWTDIVVEQLKPNKDEFMVLMCDGVWNCISNEELISFVDKRIKTTDKLSKICEKLFTRVLPPIMSTKRIVGKDNMTFIIVKFERNNQKKDRFQRIHFWEFEIYLFLESKPKKKLESHQNLYIVFNRQLSYRIKDLLRKCFFSNGLNLSSNKYKWTQNFCLNLFDLCLIDNTLKNRVIFFY